MRTRSDAKNDAADASVAPILVHSVRLIVTWCDSRDGQPLYEYRFLCNTEAVSDGVTDLDPVIEAYRQYAAAPVNVAIWHWNHDDLSRLGVVLHTDRRSVACAPVPARTMFPGSMVLKLLLHTLLTGPTETQPAGLVLPETLSLQPLLEKLSLSSLLVGASPHNLIVNEIMSTLIVCDPWYPATTHAELFVLPLLLPALKKYSLKPVRTTSVPDEIANADMLCVSWRARRGALAIMWLQWAYGTFCHECDTFCSPLNGVAPLLWSTDVAVPLFPLTGVFYNRAKVLLNGIEPYLRTAESSTASTIDNLKVIFGWTRTTVYDKFLECVLQLSAAMEEDSGPSDFGLIHKNCRNGELIFSWASRADLRVPPSRKGLHGEWEQVDDDVSLLRRTRDIVPVVADEIVPIPAYARRLIELGGESGPPPHLSKPYPSEAEFNVAHKWESMLNEQPWGDMRRRCLFGREDDIGEILAATTWTQIYDTHFYANFLSDVRGAPRKSWKIATHALAADERFTMHKAYFIDDTMKTHLRWVPGVATNPVTLASAWPAVGSHPTSWPAPVALDLMRRVIDTEQTIVTPTRVVSGDDNVTRELTCMLKAYMPAPSPGSASAGVVAVTRRRDASSGTPHNKRAAAATALYDSVRLAAVEDSSTATTFDMPNLGSTVYVGSLHVVSMCVTNGDDGGVAHFMVTVNGPALLDVYNYIQQHIKADIARFVLPALSSAPMEYAAINTQFNELVKHYQDPETYGDSEKVTTTSKHVALTMLWGPRHDKAKVGGYTGVLMRSGTTAPMCVKYDTLLCEYTPLPSSGSIEIKSTNVFFVCDDDHALSTIRGRLEGHGVSSCHTALDWIHRITRSTIKPVMPTRNSYLVWDIAAFARIIEEVGSIGTTAMAAMALTDSDGIEVPHELRGGQHEDRYCDTVCLLQFCEQFMARAALPPTAPRGLTVSGYASEGVLAAAMCHSMPCTDVLFIETNTQDNTVARFEQRARSRSSTLRAHSEAKRSLYTIALHRPAMLQGTLPHHCLWLVNLAGRPAGVDMSQIVTWSIAVIRASRQIQYACFLVNAGYKGVSMPVGEWSSTQFKLYASSKVEIVFCSRLRPSAVTAPPLEIERVSSASDFVTVIPPRFGRLQVGGDGDGYRRVAQYNEGGEWRHLSYSPLTTSVQYTSKRTLSAGSVLWKTACVRVDPAPDAMPCSGVVIITPTGEWVQTLNSRGAACTFGTLLCHSFGHSCAAPTVRPKLRKTAGGGIEIAWVAARRLASGDHITWTRTDCVMCDGSSSAAAAVRCTCSPICNSCFVGIDPAVPLSTKMAAKRRASVSCLDAHTALPVARAWKLVPKPLVLSRRLGAMKTAALVSPLPINKIDISLQLANGARGLSGTKVVCMSDSQSALGGMMRQVLLQHKVASLGGVLLDDRHSLPYSDTTKRRALLRAVYCKMKDASGGMRTRGTPVEHISLACMPMNVVSTNTVLTHTCDHVFITSLYDEPSLFIYDALRHATSRWRPSVITVCVLCDKHTKREVANVRVAIPVGYVKVQSVRRGTTLIAVFMSMAAIKKRQRRAAKTPIKPDTVLLDMDYLHKYGTTKVRSVPIGDGEVGRAPRRGSDRFGQHAIFSRTTQTLHAVAPGSIAAGVKLFTVNCAYSSRGIYDDVGTGADLAPVEGRRAVSTSYVLINVPRSATGMQWRFRASSPLGLMRYSCCSNTRLVLSDEMVCDGSGDDGSFYVFDVITTRRVYNGEVLSWDANGPPASLFLAAPQDDIDDFKTPRYHCQCCEKCPTALAEPFTATITLPNPTSQKFWGGHL
jgi:hypothetical protein